MSPVRCFTLDRLRILQESTHNPILLGCSCAGARSIKPGRGLLSKDTSVRRFLMEATLALTIRSGYADHVNNSFCPLDMENPTYKSYIIKSSRPNG